MFAAVLLSTLVATTTTVAVQNDPPVEVWTNKGDHVAYGDRMKVYVRSEYDGYVLVLNADPEGRIRVLYPLDPGQDDYVRGGKRYEIEGRVRGGTFRVGDTPGIGTVYVAYSEDPFTYDAFALNGHWDYRTIGDLEVVGNAEDELTSLVNAMARSRFDYDTEDYYVASEVDYRARYRSYYGGYSPYAYDPYYYRGAGYGYGSGLSVGFFFGSSYGYGYGYRPHHFRWGLYAYDPFYDPFFYDPFYYDPYFGGFGFSSSYYYPVGRATTVVFVNGGRHGAVVNRRYAFRDVGPVRRTGYRTRSAVARAVPTRAGVRTPTRRVAPTRTAGSTARPAPNRRTVATTRNGQITTGRRRAAPAPSRLSPQATNGTPRRVEPDRRGSSGSAATGRRTTPRRGSMATRTRSTRPQPAHRSGPRGRRSAESQRLERRGSVSPRESERRSSAVAPPAARGEPQNGSTARSARPTRRSSAARPSGRPSRSSAARPAPRRSRSVAPVPRPTPSRATPARRGRRAGSRSAARPSSRPVSRAGSPRVSRPAPRRSTSAARARPAPSRSARPTSRPSRSAPRAAPRGGSRRAVSPQRSSRPSRARKPVRKP